MQPGALLRASADTAWQAGLGWRPGAGRLAFPQEQREPSPFLGGQASLPGMWLDMKLNCLHLGPLQHRCGPGLRHDRRRWLSPGSVGSLPTPFPPLPLGSTYP